MSCNAVEPRAATGRPLRPEKPLSQEAPLLDIIISADRDGRLRVELSRDPPDPRPSAITTVACRIERGMDAECREATARSLLRDLYEIPELQDVAMVACAIRDADARIGKRTRF